MPRDTHKEHVLTQDEYKMGEVSGVNELKETDVQMSEAREGSAKGHTQGADTK